MSEYQVPKVWQENPAQKNPFGNQPTAGSRFEQKLPIGKHPLQVYSLGTPNGQKVAILLEELKEAKVAAAEYDLYRIDIMKGEQFGSEFVKINPNSKIPAMVDYSVNPPLPVFESASILLYLAEKYQQFIPTTLAKKTEMMNWLFWQTGAAPLVGGGFGHFYHYAPFAQEYPINRYAMETKRQLDVLDQHLSDKEYMLGETYTIADMLIWPWYGRLVRGEMYGDAGEFLQVQEYPYLIKWAEKIGKRPAVQRALTLEYQEIN